MTRTGGPEGPQPAGSAPAKVRVWDPWVRLTHWSLVLLVPALWLTAEKGFLSVHRTLGEVVVGLLLFRIYWGFAGSETARFASFVKGPGAVVAYLKGLGSKTAGHAVGHNAAGGWSILLMLLAGFGYAAAAGLLDWQAFSSTSRPWHDPASPLIPASPQPRPARFRSPGRGDVRRTMPNPARVRG